ncbi:MAG TPA: sulfatase-like hydrolase/transferase [Planctomycetota bacterium]
MKTSTLRRTLLATLVVGILWTPGAAQRTRQAPRIGPNVLVIVLDDVGTEKLEFYGETPPTCPGGPCDPLFNCSAPSNGCVQPYARTPNLDALRRGGLWFDKAYAMPVCSATRAAIQTGRYGTKTGIGNITSTTSQVGDYSLPNSEILLAELLRDGFQGAAKRSVGHPYRSGAFGKWHVTAASPSEYGHAVANGYERFYGIIGNVTNHFRFTQVLHDKGSSVLTEKIDGRFTTPPYEVDTYQASLTTRDTLAWIQAQTGSFMAYVGYGPPHTPVQVPPASLLSQEMQCELACAGLAPGNILNVFTEPPALLKLVYRAQVEAVDAEIGKLLAGIPAGVLENTTIFVIGDNGTPIFQIDEPPHVANHGKATVFELGVRVPLIVSSPLIPPPPTNDGWRSSALVSAADLWLTIAELTGANAASVKPLALLDSVSFLPVITDPLNTGSRTAIYTQTFLPNGVLPLPQPSCYSLNRRAVTDGEYKYIRAQTSVDAAPCGTASYGEALYHLPSDPGEVANLISLGLTPDQQQRLQILSAEMDAHSGN